MTLSSLGNQTRLLLEEQARHLLNEQERATMAYYLDEYRGGSVSVEALVMALFELLNTHAKVTQGGGSRGLCLLPVSPTPFLCTCKESGGSGPGRRPVTEAPPSQGRQPPDSWGNRRLKCPVMWALATWLSMLSIHLVAVDAERTSRIVWIALQSDARASPQAG